MKKLILTSALGAAVLLVSACGDNEADVPVAEDTAAADAAAAAAATGGATASADWPTGTRIVEEEGVTYRVNADGTRVELGDDDWRIVTEGDVRYRVDPNGTRIRIDDDGLDLDGDGDDPDGIDVDVTSGEDGNLDVDVSTDGEDATPDRDG